MTARLVSVNVATPVEAPWLRSQRRTAIDKRPVAGPVRVDADGLNGDQVGNPEHHGGTFQALYAYAQEDLDFWTEQLGGSVPPGTFGENLTTAGIDVNAAVLGERWRVGTALLQVCSVRIPCSVFRGWMGESGYDDTAWVKRFTAEGRPGPYLRVLEAGELRAGDEVVVERRPQHGVTVTTMFRALTTERSLLPELLKVDEIDPEAHETARAYLARQTS